MEQVPEYVPKKKNIFRREKINLFTDIEDEEEIIPEEAQEEQPELEDFTSKEDNVPLRVNYAKYSYLVPTFRSNRHLHSSFAYFWFLCGVPYFLVLISVLLHMQPPAWYFWQLQSVHVQPRFLTG